MIKYDIGQIHPIREKDLKKRAFVSDFERQAPITVIGVTLIIMIMTAMIVMMSLVLMMMMLMMMMV